MGAVNFIGALWHLGGGAWLVCVAVCCGCLAKTFFSTKRSKTAKKGRKQQKKYFDQILKYSTPYFGDVGWGWGGKWTLHPYEMAFVKNKTSLTRMSDDQIEAASNFKRAWYSIMGLQLSNYSLKRMLLYLMQK